MQSECSGSWLIDWRLIDALIACLAAVMSGGVRVCYVDGKVRIFPEGRYEVKRDYILIIFLNQLILSLLEQYQNAVSLSPRLCRHRVECPAWHPPDKLE